MNSGNCLLRQSPHRAGDGAVMRASEGRGRDQSVGRLCEVKERAAPPKGYFLGHQPGSDEPSPYIPTRASVLESKAWVLSLLTNTAEPLPPFPDLKMSNQM